MKVTNYKDSGTDPKVRVRVGSGLVLGSVVHPQSKVLTVHLFLADIDAMKVLVAFTAGESVVPPASRRLRAGSRNVQLREKQAENFKMPLN